MRFLFKLYCLIVTIAPSIQNKKTEVYYAARFKCQRFWTEASGELWRTSFPPSLAAGAGTTPLVVASRIRSTTFGRAFLLFWTGLSAGAHNPRCMPRTPRGCVPGVSSLPRGKCPKCPVGASYNYPGAAYPRDARTTLSHRAARGGAIGRV